MRQRLGLAAALLRSPRLLILDEPTNGLDPQGIREIRSLLAELNAAGTTVFLSSHQLSEVELLCTRIGVLEPRPAGAAGRPGRAAGADRPRRWSAAPTPTGAREVLDGEVALAQAATG